MEISQHALEQFVVVAEEEHIGRAAVRLMMTQPPLTQAVQRLERAMGVELLERSRRGVRLTDAGRSFAADARQLLDAQKAAIDRARRIANGSRGDLKVGYAGGFTHHLVPSLLALVHNEFQDLRVHLFQKPSAELAVAVRAGSLDIALVRSPLVDGSGIDLHPLPDERLCVAVPSGHRLALADSVQLRDLCKERFALLPAGSSELAEQVQSVCRRAGFVPVDGARADGLPGLLGHVAAAGCVTLVPSSLASESGAGFVVKDLADVDDDLFLHSCVAVRTGAHDVLVNRVVSLLVEP